MIVSNSTISTPCEPGEFVGLRLTADEFFEIPDEDTRYELIDGVVVMSPSPFMIHQIIADEILVLIRIFLRQEPLGVVARETDVRFSDDLVYRPEIIFYRAGRVKSAREPQTEAPDLVVEVVSKSSRRMDTITKMHDYEKHGVKEYWLIDPEQKSMTFYRLESGKFVEAKPAGERYESPILPGFTLELPPIRAMFDMQ